MNDMDLSLRKENSSDIKVTSDKKDDRLFSLTRLQAADRHFIWVDVILSCFGKGQSDIVLACPKYAKKDYWFTALVIAVLEKLVNQKDLWE